MESKPHKLKKRRVRKPKTFKSKSKRWLTNQYSEDVRKAIIFISLLIGLLILIVSFNLMYPSRHMTEPAKYTTSTPTR